jgi:hypothetical protein
MIILEVITLITMYLQYVIARTAVLTALVSVIQMIILLIGRMTNQLIVIYSPLPLHHSPHPYIDITPTFLHSYE